ncbi:MAG: hypothetical protein DMF84_28875 [Acidobacteria bacterium]|nr:MAG: hypothetical protein DMF84_28875 [Acidobacteriota bacterium]
MLRSPLRRHRCGVESKETCDPRRSGEMASLHITSVVRNALRGATRLAPRLLCACVSALFGLLASVESQADPGSFVQRPPAVSRSHAVLTEPPASDSATFRLGNAAKPFGWSTVIGDFNTDGRPDVAVADHIWRGASRYEYRIGFSMSGQAPDAVTFESTHDAVTITASDVDRDRDLDIIVALPISGETVGVWLNDGHGHFTCVNARTFAKGLQAHQSIGRTGPFLDLEPFDVSRQRRDFGLAVTFRPASAISRYASSSSRGHRLRSSFALLRTAPRAPPIPSRGFLS